jgi:hypothetical protein
LHVCVCMYLNDSLRGLRADFNIRVVRPNGMESVVLHDSLRVPRTDR